MALSKRYDQKVYNTIFGNTWSILLHMSRRKRLNLLATELAGRLSWLYVRAARRTLSRVAIVYMISKPLGRQCIETTFVLLDVTKL